MNVSFVFRCCIHRDYAINTVWESASQSHCCATSHTMTHHRKLLKLLLISKSNNVVREKSVVVFHMVIRLCMVTHFDEIALSFVLDSIFVTKTSPVHLAAEKSM